MIHNARHSVIPVLVNLVFFVVACCFLGLSLGANSDVLAQVAQAKAAKAHIEAKPSQQPLYSDYKGVRLGMTAAEARAKLGEPNLKADDQDLYLISDKETAEIAYDAAHKVVTISVDYLGGIGAPDYKAVVGADIEVKPNGAMYQLVRYENLGFWVCYNRTAGTLPIVTVTIQKLIN